LYNQGYKEVNTRSFLLDDKGLILVSTIVIGKEKTSKTIGEVSMLQDQIDNDYKKAMLEKNQVKSSTVSFLRAQIKNVIIDKKTDKLPDVEVIAIIKKQVKQRQDSIEQFGKGGRTDLVEKEKAELNILLSYLPAEMLETDLKGIVEAAVKEAQATGVKDMGKVMKVLLPQVAGKADSKRVSDLVKEILSRM